MSGIEYYHSEAEGVELIMTKGQAHCYPWHMHTRHWTVGVIRQGTVWLTTEASSQQLGQGHYFCLRPYEPHSLHVESKSALIVVCITPQSASLLKNFPEALFRRVTDLQTEERQCLVKATASHAHLGFSDIFAEKCPTAPLSLSEQSIREIMRLLLSSPADSMSIEQMAAHAGYSPWHFLRAFQKMTGMTPHAFQLLCRLRLLRSLLRTDTAACTAAVSAGFADQSHMHKVFKRHHGMTPGEFRKASVKLEL